MKLTQLFKKTKLLIFSAIAIFILIAFCSMLSMNKMSGLSQMISLIQINLMGHKALLIVSHIFVFSAIFFMGFHGFKKAAQKQNVPQKQIKAFGYLMGCFLLTVLIIDGVAFFA